MREQRHPLVRRRQVPGIAPHQFMPPARVLHQQGVPELLDDAARPVSCARMIQFHARSLHPAVGHWLSMPFFSEKICFRPLAAYVGRKAVLMAYERAHSDIPP